VSKLGKFGLAISLMMFGTAVWAGVPAGKETLKISDLAADGSKGPVEFPHAKHVNEFKKADGSAIVCKDCHHMAKSEKDAKSCNACHVLPGKAQKEVDGKKAPFMAEKKGSKYDRKSVIFHKRCLDMCHEAVKKATGKKITSCKTCHK